MTYNNYNARGLRTWLDLPGGRVEVVLDHLEWPSHAGPHSVDIFYYPAYNDGRHPVPLLRHTSLKKGGVPIWVIKQKMLAENDLVGGLAEMQVDDAVKD